MKKLGFTVMITVLIIAVAGTLVGCKLPRITVEEIQKRIDEGEPILFIDTRKSQDWNALDEKLAGALRIHYSEIERHLDELPRDRLIVPYCTSPEEASSAYTAQILLDHDFKNVFPMKGGFSAWLDAGYPLEPK